MIISTFECKSFVQNSDTTHKIIQSMFHCNRAYHNVLYMVIGKNLIIQSDIEPYEIPDSLRLMNSRNCDEMVAKINAGDVVKVFAMYEPTKKQTRIGKRSSNILIADENDRKEWVKRKFINAGNVIAINELSKNKRQVAKSCGDSHPVSVFGYEFLLRVSDANALRNLIKNGVGRSKSYGAGMSLVMGVEKQKNNLKKNENAADFSAC